MDVFNLLEKYCIEIRATQWFLSQRVLICQRATVSELAGLEDTYSVALAVILTFLFTLVVGVSIGILIVLAVNKCRRSENITLQTETEMRPPPVIYEDPDDIKPDPFTQGNVAYELVQPN